MLFYSHLCELEEIFSDYVCNKTCIVLKSCSKQDRFLEYDRWIYSEKIFFNFNRTIDFGVSEGIDYKNSFIYIATENVSCDEEFVGFGLLIPGIVFKSRNTGATRFITHDNFNVGKKDIRVKREKYQETTYTRNKDFGFLFEGGLFNISVSNMNHFCSAINLDFSRILNSPCERVIFAIFSFSEDELLTLHNNFSINILAKDYKTQTIRVGSL